MTPCRRLLLALLLLAVGMVGAGRPALAVDVSQLSDFENDPCVQALSQRNTDQHVDAPDSELSDNCDRAHGNVEVAWDFLLRTWKPRDIGGASVAPLRLDAPDLAWLLVEVLLTYAVLGAPLRPVTRLLQRTGRRRAAVGVIPALLLRFGIATLLAAVLLLPAARLLASLVLLAAIAAAVRRLPRRAPDPMQPTSSALAEFVAAAVNDAAIAAPGLLALVLATRGGWVLLGPAVLAAVVVSLPQLHRARLALRCHRLANPAAAALLAAAAALSGVADPALARLAGSTILAAAAAIMFAAVVLWRARLLGGVRPPRRAVSGG